MTMNVYQFTIPNLAMPRGKRSYDHMKMAQRAHSSNMASSEEAKECPICKEPGMDVGLRECLHRFHRGCIIEWIQCRKENCDCPICRQPIDEEMVVELDELV